MTSSSSRLTSSHEALVRAMVAAELSLMTEAQIASAKGFKYLMAWSRPGGQAKRAHAEAMDKILSDGEQIIEVWEQDPGTNASENAWPGPTAGRRRRSRLDSIARSRSTCERADPWMIPGAGRPCGGAAAVGRRDPGRLRLRHGTRAAA